jgi:hypothetical protein
MKEGALNSTIPSAVSDTSATSSAFLKKGPSRAMGELSTIVFHLPNGMIAPAMARNKLLHNVHESARSVNIIPALVENSLLSTNKFAKAGYTIIYDKDEVNFYYARTQNSWSWKRQSSQIGNAHTRKCGTSPLSPLSQILTRTYYSWTTHWGWTASTPCTQSAPAQKPTITWRYTWTNWLNVTTYTIYMNSQVSSQPFDISTEQLDSPREHHG